MLGGSFLTEGLQLDVVICKPTPVFCHVRSMMFPLVSATFSTSSAPAQPNTIVPRPARWTPTSSARWKANSPSTDPYPFMTFSILEGLASMPLRMVISYNSVVIWSRPSIFFSITYHRAIQVGRVPYFPVQKSSCMIRNLSLSLVQLSLSHRKILGKTNFYSSQCRRGLVQQPDQTLIVVLDRICLQVQCPVQTLLFISG